MPVLYVPLGDSQTMACETSDAHSVSMYFNGRLLTTNRPGMNYDKSLNQLHIMSAASHHTGSVTCEVQGEYGRFTRTTYIYVYGESMHPLVFWDSGVVDCWDTVGYPL